MMFIKQRILVIEDDPAVLTMIRSVLDYGGYDHDTAETAAEGRRLVEAGGYDAILLDLSLPDLDGSELIPFIRDTSDLPILVISGLPGEDARVDALDKGADDFIGKPFLPRELLARIRAAIRRASRKPPGTSEAALQFDPQQPFVIRGGEEVSLSSVEHQLLSLIARRQGDVLTNREACERIWGEYSDRTRKNLYVVISRLRRKIEPDPANPVHLLAHHGIGYRFKLDPAEEQVEA